MITIGRLPIPSDLALEVVRRRKMTELYREYRRCGKCRWRFISPMLQVSRCSLGVHSRVNLGWFGCRQWISLKQLALDLLRTNQR